MIPATRDEVLSRRRQGRTERIDRAACWARALPADLDVRAVAVFGSVARGDWSTASDIDVLVVAARLPASPVERMLVLGDLPERVEPVVWTPQEYRARRPGDLIRSEVETLGVWLIGSPARAGGAGTAGAQLPSSSPSA